MSIFNSYVKLPEGNHWHYFKCSLISSIDLSCVLIISNFRTDVCWKFGHSHCTLSNGKQIHVWLMVMSENVVYTANVHSIGTIIMHHWIWGILFSDKRHMGLQSNGGRKRPSSFINPQLVKTAVLFAAKNAQAYSYLDPPPIWNLQKQVPCGPPFVSFEEIVTTLSDIPA